jgi:hypothetical protein
VWLVRALLIAGLLAVLWLGVIRHPQQAGFQVHRDLVRLGQAVQSAARGSPSPGTAP